MKENKLKCGFAIMVVLITLIFFSNSIVGINGRLFIVNYIIMFSILLTWIISIVRTIKDRNKIKIIPCILIMILVIIAFIVVENVIFSGFYIEILAQIGLAIFLYEIMDIFKIELKVNILNLITISICFLIIIVFLLSQILSINKCKSSLNDISNFINSDDLTYEKLYEGYDSLVLEHMDHEEYLKKTSKKIFVTQAQGYKGLYIGIVDLLKTSMLSSITNKRTFKKNREWLKELFERLDDVCKSEEEEINKEIMKSIFFAIFDMTIVCIEGKRNQKELLS